MPHGGDRWFLRYGISGEIGRFESEVHRPLRRGEEVVARTPRGLELAEVLAPDDGEETFSEGVVLRPALDTDRLLDRRLRRYRDRAFAACRDWLAKSDLPGTLVDVEHLLDGESFYFHFLGEPPELSPEAEAELAGLYERKVHFRRFAETLASGCGPGCGTESAGGCSTGGCGTCGTGGCGVKALMTKTATSSPRPA